MKTFQTKAIINAKAEKVFDTITDFDAYPHFDPNTIKIDGNAIENTYIKINSKLSPQTIRMKIVEVDAPKKMVWQSKLPLNLYSVTTTFRVLAKDDQTSEFHMEEVFDGILFSVFKNLIPDLNQPFAQFSRGLKHYIESRG